MIAGIIGGDSISRAGQAQRLTAAAGRSVKLVRSGFVQMTRLIEAQGYKFIVEDSWLTESEIKPFSKAGGHYKYLKKDAREVFIVMISDINPSIRGEGVPIFKDGEVEGKLKSMNDRVADILIALRDDIHLPPIEIEEINEERCRYKLYHGCHRLHLSILIGFDSIPAVIVSKLC